jgi:hypothetical protein
MVAIVAKMSQFGCLVFFVVSLPGRSVASVASVAGHMVRLDNAPAATAAPKSSGVRMTVPQADLAQRMP